jgi:2,3-bisphosphoglycerate-independent phosphoglycerate mutase
MHKKRVILIVGDGMADRPLPELNGRTPLEVANPINMHRLAANGISGLLDPVAPGIVPGTETAHLSILGYDPTIISSGRGPFEAAGAGIDIKAGDVAFRSNFATVTEDFIVVDERAGRIQTEAAELAKELQNIQIKKFPNVKFTFKQTLSFRGALVLRGDKLSPNVSAVMPQPGDFVGSVKPSDESFEATRTAQILTEFIKTSNALLKNHPINLKRKAQGKPAANAVLPWSGGYLPQMEPFNEKYRLKSACVAAASIIKGIGRLAGMQIVNVKGATGEIDTDTTAKADAALNSLKDHNFVLVHVEAADEASHDGNVKGKIEIIKKIDAMVGRILDNINLEDVNIVLLSDHVTSTQLRKHTDDPVPIVIAGGKVLKDGIKEFSERAASEGGLERIQGKQVMPLIMDLLDKPNRTLG